MPWRENGELVYDADLTGRPVSSTSTSYPDAAFGHMGDTISLGYQAALVSLHSPTFGRLWLANQLHPGDTVSMTEAQALVIAAENRTGRRPKRRTDLLKGRLAQAEADRLTVHLKLDHSFDKHREAQATVKDTVNLLREWEHRVRDLDRRLRAAKSPADISLPTHASQTESGDLQQAFAALPKSIGRG